MITEDTILKLLVLHRLIQQRSGEYLLYELAWDIGAPLKYLEDIISDLGRNYLLRLEDGKVVWNPADNPSTLRPWGWNLIHKALVGTTQEVARGLGPWSIVVSEYMLLGRGRHGKKWYSGLGGLWVTFKIPTTSTFASMAPIIVPIILIRILRRNYGIENSYIKWPNDIIVNDKKIAGILIEAEAFREQILLYIGIGININNEAPLPNTISLKNILGDLTPRNRFLSLLIGWISRFEKLAMEPDKVREKYLEYLATLNRRVVAKTVMGEVKGVAVDVTDTGELIIDAGEGARKKLDPVTTYEIRHLE